MFQIIKIKCKRCILEFFKDGSFHYKKNIYLDLCKLGGGKSVSKRIIKMYWNNKYTINTHKSFFPIFDTPKNWTKVSLIEITIILNQSIYIYIKHILCNNILFQIIIPRFHFKFAHVSYLVIGTQFLFACAFVKSSFTRGAASLLLSLG